MWLRRYSEERCRNRWQRLLVPLLTCVLVTGGCGSTPNSQRSDNRGQVEMGPDGRPLPAKEIPPKAQTMFEQAVAVMATGDSIDAELRFQDFLLRYPGYPGAHVNLAIIFADRGDDAAAEGSLTDALILDPLHAPALNQLGMLLRRQGKFAKAESAYLKAVTAEPDYALAHYNLGVLNELYLQQLDVALQHFENYQAISGEDKQVTKWIADLKRRISSNQRTASVTE